MGLRTLTFADGTNATSGTSGTFEALNWLRVRYMVLLCLWICGGLAFACCRLLHILQYVKYGVDCRERSCVFLA